MPGKDGTGPQGQGNGGCGGRSKAGCGQGAGRSNKGWGRGGQGCCRGTGQGLGGVRGPVKVFRGMPREWVYIAEEPGRLLLEFPPLLFYICRAMLKSRGTCRRSKVREDLTVRKEEAIQKFHNGPARKLYSRYVGLPPESVLPYALAKGLVSFDDIPHEVAEEMRFKAKFFK